MNGESYPSADKISKVMTMNNELLKHIGDSMKCNFRVKIKNINFMNKMKQMIG